ncbi:MAG: beta-propeller domain-containing protein [Thermoguttaceae bacterium]
MMEVSFPRMRRPRRSCLKQRRLCFEPLEHRMLLDVGAAGAVDDLFEVRQNSEARLLDVLDNDTFAPDYTGARRITSVSYGSEGGRVEMADDGLAISYAPPADFSGAETFVYYVDGRFSATVTVNIDSPLAPDTYAFAPDGEPRILDVLGNDPFWADYDGPRQITAVGEPPLGSELEIAADGKSLRYTPPRDAYGKDAFVYIVDNLYPAEIKIDILNPLKANHYREIVQNSENNVLHVLANDSFWPGYPGAGSITHLTTPDGGGTATIAADGKTVLYTPAPDRSGWDGFTYVVDGVYEASVSLQVHRPVRDDQFEVDTGSTNYRLNLTENDVYSFWDGNHTVTRDVIDRVTSVGQTTQGGTVEITADGQGILYSVPADFEGAHFEGIDTFEYIADGKHRATVEVFVTRPVRDDYIYNKVYEDTVGNVLYVMQNDFQGNGYEGPKIITSVSETSEGGAVTILDSGRLLQYTPPTGFQGMDTFSYVVDGRLEANVKVHIGSLTKYDTYRFSPDPTRTDYALDVLRNDHFGWNYRGPGLITSVGETLGGSLVTISDGGRSLRFVPAEGGSDEFTYTVDGKYEASVSVSFWNFLSGDSFVVDQNSPANELTPLENDFLHGVGKDYSGPRQITSVGPSEHGATITIAADGKTVSYLPAPDFCGTDRFTYTVDGLMQQNVSVQVIRRVRDDSFRVEAVSRPNDLPVLINDLFGADYTGAGRITSVTATSAGAAASVGELGASIVYTPPEGFSGEDTLTYTVDGALKADVTVWVGTSVDEMLPRFDSSAEFQQFLLDGALQRYEYLFGTVRKDAPMPEWYDDGVVTTMSDPATERSYSETNVQVAGVDEADIIETDGDYLYVLTGNELIIAKAWPAEDLAIASRVTIRGELIGEYLHGDRLTVISKTWKSYSPQPWDPMGFRTDMTGIWWPRPMDSDTWVTVLDVSDRQSPTIVEQTKLEGAYVESRRIDDTVFLVLRDDGVDRWLPKPELLPLPDGTDGSRIYETREQYIERVTARMEDFLPHYTSYGAEGRLLRTGMLQTAGRVFQPTGPEARSLVTVASMNISDEVPGIVTSTAIFTSGASKIYASLESLYVFDERYEWEDGSVTKILKFDWDADTGRIRFAAKGQVPGRMVNQFSADEFRGNLRIATTISNSYSGNWSGRSENVLFVLRDDGGVLEFVGSMKNLALDERIRSVRFMGDRAFVTTFRNIDPLFALDLSDPTHPQPRGYVTLPGYSSYMQLIDEHTLLAVGRNTSLTGTGPTQVSLFDIEDLSQPRVIDQYTFERFSTSEAETDHHAFGWFAPHNVLAMPSTRVYWERVDLDGDGYRETRQSVREDELILLSIDATATRLSGDGIRLLGQVEHDSPVRRSVYIDDVLYSIAENSASAVSIVDPTVRFAEIEFGIEPNTDWRDFGRWVQILDDTDMGFDTFGYWVSDPGEGLYDGTHSRLAGDRGDVASWTFQVTPGYYRVAATWPQSINASPDAPFTVLDGSTPLETVRVDQRTAPDDLLDGPTAWENLGVFRITGDRLVVTLSDDAEQTVIADAIRVERVSFVAGRHVFYNDSVFDGEDPDANAADDDAIDDGKQALLPGQEAAFKNYTSYQKGLNGIMVDVAGLVDGDALSAADDFLFRVGNSNDPPEWSSAPDPVSITVRPGAGVDQSDRVTILWTDNAIEKQWLQVTVGATENTGLREPDVFYFGNAVGESGDQQINAAVNATDEIVARNFQHSPVDPALIDDPYDYNRDGLVNGTDQIIARNNQTNPLTMLRLIDAPDAIVQEAIEQFAGELSAANLDWTYEFEQIAGRQSKRSSAQSQQAVDMLLASLS